MRSSCSSLPDRTPQAHRVGTLFAWAGTAFTAIPSRSESASCAPPAAPGIADLVVSSVARGPTTFAAIAARSAIHLSGSLSGCLQTALRRSPRGPLGVTARRRRHHPRHDGGRVAALVRPGAPDEPELLPCAPPPSLTRTRLRAAQRAAAEVRASRTRIIEAGDAGRRRLGRDLTTALSGGASGSGSLQLARGRSPTGTAPSTSSSRRRTPVGGALQGFVRSRRHPSSDPHRRGPCAGNRRPRGALQSDQAYCRPTFARTGRGHGLPSRARLLRRRKTAHASGPRSPSPARGVESRSRSRTTVSADPTRGTSLRGLRDRVEALDGHLEVGTQVGGTRVTAVIPCV
jgi:hypothetical protein